MEAQNPLSSSPIYPYLHQFLLDQKGYLPAGMNSQKLFAEVFLLCRQAVTGLISGEDLVSRYIDEFLSRTGNSRYAELILCLSWVVLMVQEHPSYTVSTFAQRLQPLIRHTSIYNKARQLAVTIRQHERHIQTDFQATLKFYPDTENAPLATDSKPSAPNSKPSNIDIEPIRQEILVFVSKVRPLLDDAWKADYQKIWEDILNMQEVRERIYAPGKQKHTNFNQYLVGNILYFIFEDCGACSDDKEYNASEVCKKLIGTTEHQLRKELSKLPPEEIKNRLHDYFAKRFEL